MKALLIRHPQTEWNRAGRLQGRLDSPITPRGLAECDALITAIAASGLKPERVFSSPLGRAQQTALLIAERFHCALQLEAALQEQDFGEFEGRVLHEIRREYPLFAEDEHFQPPLGESLAQAVARVQAFLQRLPTQCTHEAVALVSHGQIIQGIIAQLMDNSLANMARYRHPNASYALLDIDGDACRVARWGIASHLLRLPDV
ncbi:histidine phosphatase family protein [Enterobacter sp. Bisph1]|uniref:histidine phosphatase family protein n=1 Tax=Enterobacter sp. Bisph1 TaxID=1274399 RepID=UPI00057C08E3|nr:histidine phosphatase family protein [Enterobacter sp. Bisph1]